VNDAFGAAHRAHASNHGITKFVKHKVGGEEMNVSEHVHPAPYPTTTTTITIIIIIIIIIIHHHYRRHWLP